MDEQIREALMGPNTTIDITTTGRRSGEPRRIETVFRRVGDEIYLSGLPGPTPRAWLLNLEANPRFTFHLKHGVVADLPATATVITDPDERRRIMAPMVEAFDRNHGPDSPFPKSPLEEWVANSPLARVSFDAAD
jgi:deazaflavin-dependent oxidoreductase (nitroreductase family)